jgi:uncharacterized protein
MKTIQLFISMLLITNTCFSQTTSKTEKIKTLLEVTGSGNLGVQAVTQMIAAFKENYSNIGDEFWNEFAKEIKSEDLVNLIIPVYDKYYTEEDVDQMIAFYKTPVGKKLIEVLPKISQESMAVGQEWGKGLGEKVVARMKEKGHLK